MSNPWILKIKQCAVEYRREKEQRLRREKEKAKPAKGKQLGSSATLEADMKRAKNARKAIEQREQLRKQLQVKKPNKPPQKKKRQTLAERVPELADASVKKRLFGGYTGQRRKIKSASDKEHAIKTFIKLRSENPRKGAYQIASDAYEKTSTELWEAEKIRLGRNF